MNLNLQSETDRMFFGQTELKWFFFFFFSLFFLYLFFIFSLSFLYLFFFFSFSFLFLFFFFSFFVSTKFHFDETIILAGLVSVLSSFVVRRLFDVPHLWKLCDGIT